MKHKQIKRSKKICFKNPNTEPLDAIFKWTGGKRKEIKFFEKFYPSFVKRGSAYTYVEPFVGGGAVFFNLNNLLGRNVINDFDIDVVSFYKEFYKSNPKFTSELDRISKIKTHDELEAEYYSQRNKDRNNNYKNISSVDRSIRFFTVNQLAFSGMRRFNATGHFNVPFGHYKKLNANVIHSEPHKTLLTATEIYNGDFEPVMLKNDKEDTFIFLDPPYTRVFKKYSAANSFGEEDHRRLAKTIKSIKHAKVMMIIDKSDFTEKLYKGMIKSSYTLKYGVNIKNRFNQSVEHLIVCNY